MALKHYGSPGQANARMESDLPLRMLNGAHINPRAPIVHDSFLYGAGAFNSHVPQYWVTTETGAATAFAPGTGNLSGLAIAVTGATTNNAEEIAGKNICWKPSTMGPITLEVRAKFVGATTATDGDFYIGLADASTYTNGLSYVFSAASAFTTSAPSDFVGFGYSSIPTSGTLFTAGGNVIGLVTSIAGTDAVASSGVVKDSNFHIYRVVVDTGGTATFQIDDVDVGVVASATTAATALVPYIGAIAKNSHALTATIDYITVAASYA